MAADLCFAIPGDIGTLTGGYAYDRRLIQELRALGWRVEHLALGPSFPFPSADDLVDATRRFSDLADASLVLVDGLAYGAMPEIAEGEAARLKLVALVHHPLAEETGLDPETSNSLRRSETRALAAASGVIATSATTAARLVDVYGVASSKLAVARPGSDPVALPQRYARAGPVALLSVGTLTHRKGHDLLIETLAQLTDLSWICRIVGSPDRAPQIAADLRRRIAAHGLDDRILLLGEVHLTPFYREADLFALASRHEGYGMVFAEALRHGLPIVATSAGAIPEAVPATAGLLVPPEDVTAFAAALARLIRDPSERARYAAGARSAAFHLPRWADTAQLVTAALRQFSGSG